MIEDGSLSSFLKIFYWNIVDLQLCAGFSFRCREKQFSYTHIFKKYISFFLALVSIIGDIESPPLLHWVIIIILHSDIESLPLLQDMEYSSLHYTVGFLWPSILSTVVCRSQSQTPNLSLSCSPNNHKSAFHVHESVSVPQINSPASLF